MSSQSFDANGPKRMIKSNSAKPSHYISPRKAHKILWLLLLMAIGRTMRLGCRYGWQDFIVTRQFVVWNDLAWLHQCNCVLRRRDVRLRTAVIDRCEANPKSKQYYPLNDTDTWFLSSDFRTTAMPLLALLLRIVHVDLHSNDWWHKSMDVNANDISLFHSSFLPK